MRADTRTNVILKTDDVFETPRVRPLKMCVCASGKRASVNKTSPTPFQSSAR
jgi:hypothetical protein